MTLRVLADAEAIAAEARTAFVAAARDALAERGSFRVALAGGSTPRKLYALLVDAAVDWSRVEVFFGDERCVAPDHADSNFRMAREALLAHVALPRENVHRIPAEEADPRRAARLYESELRAAFGCGPDDVPRFDLVLLGMGADGHTASLFPGTSALEERTALVAANWVEKLASARVTLTWRALNAARQVLFLVAGADKAAALREVLEGPSDVQRLPAQGVRPEAGQLVWLVDRAAAARLSARA